MEDMEGKIDAVVDGGPCQVGVESTILDLTCTPPRLLRPGGLPLEALEEVAGPVAVDKAVTERLKDGEQPKAPGMKYRHYAPKASMVLVEGAQDKVITYINEEAKKKREQGLRIGIMATDESKELYKADVVISVGSRISMDSVAHNLFRALRDFDEENVDFIYSESFDTKWLRLCCYESFA